MKFILQFILALITVNGISQRDSVYFYETEKFWEDQNSHYLDKESSPLDKKARKAFTGHLRYEYNPDYVITAGFQRITNGDTVVMKTSADTEKSYIKYAQLHFNLGRSHCHLYVYQSLAMREIEEYKNYLFIPFKDLTSGNETYGGGRYLDVLIPEGNQIVINFNLAYNPYCAYTDGYFCPIPPAENTLNVEVKAGAKAPVIHE